MSMRVNWVARDGKNTQKQYTSWSHKPEFDCSLWCVPLCSERGLGAFGLLSASEAKALVGRTLKPGEIWDRRRNTIQKG